MSTEPERARLPRFGATEIDARGPALFRIALGVLVAMDLADRLRDFHAFYGAGGVVPPPAHGGWLRLWSLIPPGDERSMMAAFALTLLAAAALSLGLLTRVAAVVTFVGVVSIDHRNMAICDGGDDVVRALLFWAMFVDLGARGSLDVRWRRRPGRAFIPALPVHLLQLQIALIYLTTFLAKRGDTWWHGEAVRLAAGSSDFGRAWGHALAQHPRVCRVLTHATLVIEASFAPLLLSPWWRRVTRPLALASGLALHLGIFLTMRVGIFPWAMLTGYLVLVPATWLARWPLFDWIERTPLTLGSRPSPARRWLFVALAGQFALIAVEQIATLTQRPLPAPIAVELNLVAQRQSWHMFSPDAPTVDVSWEAPGTLVDGQTVDVGAVVAPGLVDVGGFRFRRWYKLRGSLLADPDLRVALGRYLCRRWNGEGRRPWVRKVELFARSHPRWPPGPIARELSLRQDCGVQGP